jgi:hypothetical protein
MMDAAEWFEADDSAPGAIGLMQQNAPLNNENLRTASDDGQTHPVRRVRWPMRAWLTILIVAAISFSAWPIARQHSQAIVVLRLVGGQPAPWVLRKLVMDPVRSEDVHKKEGNK